MQVPCNGCRLCCIGQGVQTDNLELQHVLVDGVAYLDHKPNGECIYLDAHGCSIYEKRPTLCRTFDCALQVKNLGGAEIRRRLKADTIDPAVVRRGRELIKRGYRPNGR